MMEPPASVWRLTDRAEVTWVERLPWLRRRMLGLISVARLSRVPGCVTHTELERHLKHIFAPWLYLPFVCFLSRI